MSRYQVLREGKAQWAVRDMVTMATAMIFTTRNGAAAHARRLEAIAP